MKFGVIVFPGSNCDHDAYHVIKHVIRQDVEFIWHNDTNLRNSDALILPGGFSYGDYLRTGAIARFSPIMKSVIRFAHEGGVVLGICNGFQILQEAGLLPGAMLRNQGLKFVCKYVNLRVEATDTFFTNKCRRGQVLRIPIAHNEGSFYADEDTLNTLLKHNQVIFRYCDPRGNITYEANPNGSAWNIAGICNKERNILAMMPHPERASESELGSADGRLIFESLVDSIRYAKPL